MGILLRDKKKMIFRTQLDLILLYENCVIKSKQLRQVSMKVYNYTSWLGQAPLSHADITQSFTEKRGGHALVKANLVSCGRLGQKLRFTDHVAFPILPLPLTFY